MRDTQFIGLTKEAQKFIEDLEPLPQDQSTFGMFQEEIPLRKWKWPQDKIQISVPERVQKACIREVVQIVPWSSGPMIFTCLELDWGFAEDSDHVKEDVLGWVADPRLGFQNEYGQRIGPEYDEEKGIYWV